MDQAITKRTDLKVYVDLDGTLINTDLLIETAATLLRKNLLFIFLFPVWLIRGRANLKKQIAIRVDIDITTLPYNEPLLALLKQRHQDGQKLILATASHEKYARAIADHLAIFDHVIASGNDKNLSGKHKLAEIIEDSGGGFAYAGNASPDIKIWQQAREAIIVNPLFGVEWRIPKKVIVNHIIRTGHNQPISFLKAMRPHQWSKNILVFLPLIVSHQFFNGALLLLAGFAFMAFCLCASSVYLLNDILDLPADRLHPTKKFRPLAAGMITPQYAVFLAAILLIVAFLTATHLHWQFLIALGVYYVFTLAYSLALKRIVLLDGFILAGLYTMRVIGGSAAVQVMPSFWLLAFSIFLFLSLAFVKRYTELAELAKNKKATVAGRGYFTEDRETLAQLGAASAFSSVLVLALYINSSEVIPLYHSPKLLWFICPLLLYWISRIWVGARRSKIDDDPVVFALRDNVSRLVIFLCGLILVLAT